MKSFHQTIIIGDGLAGLSLALELLWRKEDFLLIGEGNAASALSSGLINPWQGRRYHLLPHFAERKKVLEERLTFLEKSIQGVLTRPFLKERQLWRVALHDQDRVLIKKRIQDSQESFSDLPFSFQDSLRYMEKSAFPTINSLFGGFWSQIWQINTPEYLSALRLLLAQKGQYQKALIKDEDIHWQRPLWNVSGYKTERLVLCRGWQESQYSFFSYLPFQVSHGQRLIVSIPQSDWDHALLRQEYFLLPYSKENSAKEKLYSWGASSRWDFSISSMLCSQTTQELKKKLEYFLKIPFSIEDIQAHIRPTTRPRTAFLGQHPHHQGLFIFNGLGTQGSSWASWLARELVLSFEKSYTLGVDLDIRRYG